MELDRAPVRSLAGGDGSDGYDSDGDKPHDECGVFGIYSSQANASRVTFFALFALNHRGQESAGIASWGADRRLHVHKGMGLVSQVFTEADIAGLPGRVAIGHTRYSTAGGSMVTGAQPFVLETDLGPMAVAHNGQVVQHNKLKRLVLARGTGLFSTSDTEIIAQMLARPHDPAIAETLLQRQRAQSGGGGDKSPRPDDDAAAPAPVWPAWAARIAAFMRDCEGAYSLVVLTGEGIYGVRDPYGLRPLCVGKKVEADGSVSYMLSSESCAFGTVGAEYVREVAPGELVRIDSEGIFSFKPALAGRRPSPAFCIFEYVYFARPDSLLEGQLVHSVRTRLGVRLAKEAPTPTADIVSGVPDSSIAAAIGYSRQTGVPFSEVFCKNRYIGRTFIKPDDALRKNAIQLKYNPLTAVLAGKRVVLVDDSLVRGNTLAQLVPLLRAGGATEVHVRISSPPIRHPCFMGVDIGTYDELVAAAMDVEAIRKHIGADSLAYLSLPGMLAAVEDRDDDDGADAVPSADAAPSADGAAAGAASSAVAVAAPSGGAGRKHCAACFTGEYPIDIEELSGGAARKGTC